ncbi:MAG: hypothetical protein ACOYOK_02420 [Pseudobdellovibrionaceae bacterium]
MKSAINLHSIRVFLVCGLSVGLCLQTPVALASLGYKTFVPETWDLELSTSYFKSDSNYPDGGGSASSLSSGGQYSLLQTGVGTRVLPSEHWSLYSTLFIGNSESKNNLAGRTNSTLSHVLVGSEFLAYSDAFEIIPEVSAIIPIEKISETSDVSLNNEGVVEGTGKVTLQKDLGLFLAYGSLGYTYRDEQRSSLMPWSAGGELRFLHSRLGADLNGFQSITKDADVDNGRKVTRTSFLSRVNGGSYKFYYPDPSLVRTQIYFKHAFNPTWSFETSAGFALAGSNTAAGYDVFALLRYSFDLNRDYQVRPTPAAKIKPRPSFREDTNDGIDQNLFRVEESKIYQEPPAAVTPPPSRSAVQQQLDQTEMKIELKANKKKKRIKKY